MVFALIDFKRRDGENENQYLWRIGKFVDEGKATWKELAPLINEQWREDESEWRDESAYRKKYQYSKAFYEDVFAGMSDNSYLEKLAEEKDSIIKERMRLHDQRREYNNLVRKEARKENLFDIIHAEAKKLNENYPLIPRPDFEEPRGNKEAVLILADWHYGMVYDGLWNKYNTEICKERVSELVFRCSNYLTENRIAKLHIVLLGDMAHGAIHTGCRVASEERAVEQLIDVSELIAEVIDELSNCVPNTYIYSTYGNHMRTIQNKADSVHDDNMERILPWWLAERFVDRADIHIVPADFKELIWFTVAGWEIGCTHGDLDKLSDIGVTLNTLFNKKFGRGVDYTFSADKHHLEELDKFGIENILVPSLCGVDDYANDHRLYSNAGQILCIFDPVYGREATYNIKFNSKEA